MSNNKNETNVLNKSILNTQVQQDLEMERTDHMAYLPDMEVLDSGIDRQVLSLMEAYDPASYTAGDVKAALNHDMRNLEDFAALLSPAAQPLIEEIARAAQSETRKHFGNSIQMFTPIYIANYCENYCIYCGFNCKNKIRRAMLDPEQIEEEMKAIAATGLQEILILTGESRSQSTVPYIGEACRIARNYFKVIGLEIYPLNSDEYAYLHGCGADYITVFQETYDSGKYETRICPVINDVSLTVSTHRNGPLKAVCGALASAPSWGWRISAKTHSQPAATPGSFRGNTPMLRLHFPVQGSGRSSTMTESIPWMYTRHSCFRWYALTAS